MKRSFSLGAAFFIASFITAQKNDNIISYLPSKKICNGFGASNKTFVDHSNSYDHFFYRPPIDHLQKSINQQKTAWILMGGGVALFLTGALIPEGEETGWNLYSGYEHKNDDLKAGFWLGGTVAMLGSIPFFILSAKNKRKAISTSVILKMENTVVLQQKSIINQLYPAAGIRLNFK